jgi:hypothetical protein
LRYAGRGIGLCSHMSQPQSIVARTGALTWGHGADLEGEKRGEKSPRGVPCACAHAVLCVRLHLTSARLLSPNRMLLTERGVQQRNISSAFGTGGVRTGVVPLICAGESRYADLQRSDDHYPPSVMRRNILWVPELAQDSPPKSPVPLCPAHMGCSLFLIQP